MHLEINTCFADMPTSIRSYVVAGIDNYTIVINSHLSHDMQLLAYQHEMNHINRGDYDKKCNIDLIEINAHSMKKNEE